MNFYFPAICFLVSSKLFLSLHKIIIVMWLCGLTKSCKNLVYTGIAVLCWAIWHSRNDIVFQRTKNQTSLQILFRATYLTRAWAILHKEEDSEAIATSCRMLETVGMDFFFATNGWMFSNRLGL